MAENLSIFGVEYSNVAGFKVLNTSGVTLAFPLASGTLDVSAEGIYDVASYAYVNISGNNNFASLVQGQITGAFSFPDNISYIASSTFAAQSGITALYGANVEKIGYNAFGLLSNLESVDFPNVSEIMGVAFNSCSKLSYVNLPNVQYVSSGCFRSCNALTSLYLPELYSISGEAAIGYMSSLTTLSLPKLTYINGPCFSQNKVLSGIYLPEVIQMSASIFAGCNALSYASFPKLTYLSAAVFSNCYKLISLYLTGSQYCSAGSLTQCFNSTPIAGYTASTGGVYGSIFVPAELYNTYTTGNNWSAYAARFVSLTAEEIAALG